MFRRRARFQRVMNAAELEAVNRANTLLANGQFSQAALQFWRMAQEMGSSGHPRRAANLYAQAAHAYTAAGDETQALAQARAALNLFLQYQMANRTPVFYTNITHRMQTQGMMAAAAQIEKEFAPRVGPLPTKAPPAQPVKGHLPANCPHCGAAVRSDMVDWIDATSAECPYCGSTLLAK